MGHRTNRVATEEDRPAEYITIDEAARRASLSAPTLKRMISQGTLGYQQGVRRPGTQMGQLRVVRVHWETFRRAFLDFRVNGSR
jgi:excisionase family DNA binding protein